MSISRHFASLGAPLRNIRWSWGAFDSGGGLILRAWLDETVKRQGKTYIRSSKWAVFEDRRKHLGWNERLSHVERLRAGTKGRVVGVTAVNPEARPRTIKEYDSRGIWELGDIIDIDGDAFAELKSYVPLKPTP